MRLSKLNIFPWTPPQQNMRGVAFFLLILLFQGYFCGKLTAQQTVSGVPLSSIHNLPALDLYEVMPDYSQVKKAMRTDEASSRLKRLEFAHVFDLNLHPENSGEWQTLHTGDRIWRLGIVSRGAYSLNMIFGTFNLEADVKVYVYSPNHKHLLGAYSSLNNNAAGKLAIEPLPGDSLIVEMNFPASANNYGTIEISRLGHDFMNIFGTSYKSAGGMAGSGACNADINCDVGITWQREKYAVCKLIIDARDICTGTLLNNTAKDRTPYVLTANHCIDTTIKAAATVFIFNYEKWKCGGQDGPKPVTLSGSNLIATTPNLDFSLVRLYDMPIFSARPYLAGWNRSNIAALNTSTIHHPNGDFKKISIDENPAVSATYAEDYNPNSHWLINKWEVGTTERGSSGAPLFNQYRQVVGDLTGGDATCSSSVRDYFAKLYNSWSDYPEWKRQLRHWLDPLNSDSISITGLDPYELEKASCDTFRTVSTLEQKQLYNSTLTWGSYSGHNSLLITQFAEKIDVEGILKIPGFYLDVAKAYNASPLSFITIKLWRGGDVPGDLVTARSVYLKDLTPNKLNYLEFDSTIFVSGPVYLGYSVNYSAPQDTFALFQAKDRGAAGYSGMFVYKDGNWVNISEVTVPKIYSSLSLGLISCGLINKIPDVKSQSHKLFVYPNPVEEGLLKAFVPFSENIIVNVYDLIGRSVRADWVAAGNEIQINTAGLSSGTYILKVMIPGEGIYNAKFLVIR